MSLWLVHFENTKIVRTFWLQVTNSWNSWFFSLFASWLVVASKPNTPFSGNIVSSWLRALMQQTQAPHLFLNIVCSWVREFVSSYAAYTTAWFLARVSDFVSSCVINASRLIFSTNSWLREFVCCKHNRLHFGTSSWGFVSSCVVNTNRLIFSMSAWLRQVMCCQHKPTEFSKRVRDFEGIIASW